MKSIIQIFSQKNCFLCKKDHLTDKINQCITICNHSFHTSCLLEYMRTHYSCPICNKELLENKFLDDNDE
jgi:hypothetical protein